MFFDITYLSNSGFILSDGETSMVFDYQGDCPEIINAKLIKRCKQVIFFVSHAHEDHFSATIYEFTDYPHVHYVLSSDVPGIDYAASTRQFTYLEPGQSDDVCGYHIRTFGSTDEGVSFLIEGSGVTLFHAGDLNNWHWKDESTARYVRSAQEAFDAILDQIPVGIDIAFFPVDPRMGTDYALGAHQFVEKKRPHILIPMHFREDVFAPIDFEKSVQEPDTDVVILVQTGQSCRIEVDPEA